MKHFSDKTLDPDSGAAEVSTDGPAKDDLDGEEPEGGKESLLFEHPEGDGGGAGETASQGPEVARSESEVRRFHLGAWWRRIRPAEMSRPLQINELAQAAEEHLRAAAVPTLENLYLPSRLMFRLSAADWGNLMPFDDYIEEEIGTVYGRLLREPGFASLVERPEIKVLKGANLGEGDPPQVTSRFHQHLKQARWRPGQRGVAVQPTPLAAAEALPEDQLEPGAVASVGLLEALATPGAEQATARQSVRILCLEETLPLALVEARAKAHERLHLDLEGCPVTADGSRWKAAPWEALPPIAELPEIESPASPEMAEPPLLLIKAAGRSPVCWAPGGMVVIGRDPLRSNWVPDGAPTNLSGRHLALVWVADERALYALDLGSTNGVYQAGSRLSPLRPVRLELPVSLSIGTEGSLNLELYPVVVPGTKVRQPVHRPAGPRTEDELDDLPLR